MDLKELHNVLLTLLFEFDKLCRENYIEYSLHGGTLLGAIREKGFIPWDDDADVAMMRSEFDKLKSILDSTNNDLYIDGNIKFQIKSKTFPSIWIDIFVYDQISDKPILQKIKQSLLTMFDIMLRDKKSIKYSDIKKHSFFKRICFKMIYLFGKIISNKFKEKKYIKISKDKFVGEKFIFRSNDQFAGRKCIIPKTWMDHYEDIVFENLMLRCSSNSNDILISSYGENYMTPKKYDHNTEIHDQIRNNKN